ncbi:hypothetical protein BLL52_3175 [Rhodoferax antarcticus ANT.BR]|uniref:Uncharacterized protein n=1 Tax=Rhodoferax antarcticus ANT.BR TaxID=1111071 RepID=A0A1Q8YBT8_9BURK|nr:hypothetical protein BLL52_3175 [Rhodoferax antarcticus ANT.BR]
MLIAWCEEDCNRLRVGERWTRVSSITVAQPQISKKNSY